MSVTIRRPLYSGSGFALYNGSGLALSYEVTADSLEQAIFDLLTEVRAVVGGPNSTLAAELLTVKNAVKVPPEAQAYYSNIWQVLKPLFDFYEPLVPYTAGWNALFQALMNNDTPAQVNTMAPQVNNIYNIGVPSTSLPNPAPAGYGGATVGEFLAGSLGNLYDWLGNHVPLTVADALQQAAAHGFLMAGQQGYRWAGSPDWVVYSNNPYLLQDNMAPWGDFDENVPGPVDWSAWNGTDSLLDFLAAQCPLETFTTTGPEGMANAGYVWIERNYGGIRWIRSAYAEWELPYVSGLVASQVGTGGATPPIWPGAENVTFGAGVPLAAGVVIDAPLDGIELNILSSDRLIPYVGAGTFKLYRSMGRVAFKSDDGYLEPWQPVPADQCVMCPKTMSRAAGVVLSFYTGVTGLVTPWTVSA